MTEKKKVEEKSVRIPIQASDGLAWIKMVEVPSRFLPYPKGSVITYRGYTYGELIRLNQSKLDVGGEIELILEGIRTEGFEKSELSYFDYLFVAMHRKLSTFDTNTFNLVFACDACGGDNRIEMDVMKVEFTDLSTPELPIVVDVGLDKPLMFKPLTVDSFIRLSRTELLGDQMEIFLEMIDPPLPPLEKEDMRKTLTDLPGRMMEVLLQVDTLLYFGVKPVEVQCKHCSTPEVPYTMKVNIHDPGVIVEPFRGDREFVGNRIRFGLSKDH